MSKGDGDRKKQATLTSPTFATTSSKEARQRTVSEFVKMIAAADIPVQKVDHPLVRNFLRNEVSRVILSILSPLQCFLRLH